MPIAGTLGGSINSYFEETLVRGGPPIAEKVLDFVDTFLPSGPPIIEGTPGDVISDFADTFLPSPPPISEGFTEGLHDIISVFQDVSGPGLGDGFILF